MRRSVPLAFAPVLCALLTPMATAQPRYTPLGRQVARDSSSLTLLETFGALRPVDQAFADADPLSTSLRVTFADPRQPVGFSQLYRAPGLNDTYLRIDGGLVAAFPRSVYAIGPDGALPLIPPGTVFYIGSAPTGDDAKPSAPRLSPASDALRLNGRIDEGPVAASLRSEEAFHLDHPATRIGARTTIWSNETYRQRRLGSLMRSAAGSNR